MTMLLTIVAMSSSLLLGADAKVTLTPRFQPESTFGVYVETTTKQTLNLAGTNVDTKAQQILNLRATVGKVDADGNTPIDYHFDSVQVDLDIAGTKVQYDSFKPPEIQDGDPLKVLYEVFDAMMKIKWTTVVTPKHEIKEVKRVAPEELQINPLVEEFVSEDMLKDSQQRELKRLPDDPVAVGDEWTRSESSPLGGGQTMTMNITYKYEGLTDHKGAKVHKITGKATKIDYTQDANRAQGPLRVTKAEMKPDSSEIILLFDAQRGQVVDARSEVHVLGTLTFVGPGGNEIPGKVDLTIKTTATVQP